MVHLTVSAMKLSRFRGLDQISLSIQYADPVVGKENELPERFYPRSRNDRLNFMIFLDRRQRPVVLRSRRLDDDRAEQSVIFVVSQIAEGTDIVPLE